MGIDSGYLPGQLGDELFSPVIVVGNTPAGDPTLAQSLPFQYVPDPGDGSGIAIALTAAAGRGDVYVRPGTYDFSQAGSPALPLNIPASVRLYGSGDGTVFLARADTRGLFVLSNRSRLESVLITVPDAAVGATGTGLVAGTLCYVENVIVDLPTGNAGGANESLTEIFQTTNGMTLTNIRVGSTGGYRPSDVGGPALAAVGGQNLTLSGGEFNNVDVGVRLSSFCQISIVDVENANVGFDITGFNNQLTNLDFELAFLSAGPGIQFGVGAAGNSVSNARLGSGVGAGAGATAVDCDGDSNTCRGVYAAGWPVAVDISGNNNTFSQGNVLGSVTPLIDTGTGSIVTDNQGIPDALPSPLEILDEGVSLTTSTDSIDFTGDGVTTTNVGNDVTVDIPTTVVPFTDLYVALGIGSDANDGLTPATALDTLDEAIRRLNQYSVVQSRCIIHLNSGTHRWTEQVRPHFLQEQLVFWGDGAGQAGDDGFTVVSSGTLQAGSTSTSLVTTGGLIPNQFQGLTFEMTSGALTNFRRAIRNHDATNIVPVKIMDSPGVASFAIGDSYRILQSAVVITPAFTPFAVSAQNDATCGVSGCGTWEPSQFWQDTSAASRSVCCFVNLDIDPTGIPAGNVGFFGILDSSLVLFGGRIQTRTTGGFLFFSTTQRTTISGGNDHRFNRDMRAQLAVDVGISTDPRIWAGWAPIVTSGTGAKYTENGGAHWNGAFVAPTGFSIFDGQVSLTGGVYGPSSSGASLVIEGPVRGFVSGADPVLSTDVPLRVENNISGSNVAALYIAGGALIHVTRTEVIKTDGTTALVAEGDGSGFPALPAQVSLGAGVVLTAGTTIPQHALVACGGGQITFDTGILTITGFTPGTECAIRAGGLNGALIDQADLATLNTVNLLPTMTDGRYGFIRLLQ